MFDNFILELAEAEALEEAAWYDKYERRSLTREESSKLRVSKSELQCSVMHFTPKSGKGEGGYAAYTHRASSGFYARPEDIPATKLRFISSTS